MGVPITLSRVSQRILSLRGARVILSHDLAAMYEVEHRVLIQAFKRNRARFPPDFMFQLTVAEAARLRSQIVISSLGHGGPRYRPYAFTEQGIAMLSSVLRGHRAVAVNIEIMRAFVRLRQWHRRAREGRRWAVQDRLRGARASRCRFSRALTPRFSRALTPGVCPA